MRCEICDCLIPEGATECPHCGFEVAWMQTAQKHEKSSTKETRSDKKAETVTSIVADFQRETYISLAVKRAAIFPIILGIVFIVIGLFIPVPGGALTTYSWMDGERAETFEFDNRYTAIDEYVGGDAYNYVIGASLVAGKMSGYIAAKATLFVVGAVCVCGGMIMIVVAGGMNRTKKE